METIGKTRIKSISASLNELSSLNNAKEWYETDIVTERMRGAYQSEGTNRWTECKD